MSNGSRNIPRQQRTDRNVRIGDGFARRQHQQQQDGVVKTFDTAKLTPRPVTKSRNTVVFDLHCGTYSHFQLMKALEKQFNATDIIMVGYLLGSAYCQPGCTMVEVLFATPEAHRLAITRGITLYGVQYLGVPAVDNISYKDVYQFQTTQKQHQSSQATTTPMLNWPDNISEFNNTSGTVFLIEDLPLDTVDVMIDKVTKSVNAASSNEPHSSEVKKAHSVITIFAKRHVPTPFVKNMVYVVFYGHVNTLSVFKKVDKYGNGTAHLSEYDKICPQGFDFWQFHFDRVSCFNCDKSDYHFTEDCNVVRPVNVF